MYKIFAIFTTLVFFVACTSKEQQALIQTYEKEKNYHMQLQKTEKTQLYDSQVTKAMLTATYLFEQSVDKNDTRDEVFIVGIYIEEDEYDTFDEVSFEEDDYTLLLRDTRTKKSKSKKDKDIKSKTKKDKAKKDETKKDKSPKSVKKLKFDDPLLKDISFKSEWSKFYLVTFPHTKKKSFKLIFESDFYGKGELNFAKVSKFVLTKQAF
ncbi:MAG: hypothetical protein J7J02_02005 [Sulfurovum sp.]|nr:hypothetical protein [Sulfurovum sp.]